MFQWKHFNEKGIKVVLLLSLLVQPKFKVTMKQT